jgi:hypothetical protein
METDGSVCGTETGGGTCGELALEVSLMLHKNLAKL